jgi:diguanylate cyclase (GGDEF)-like protein
MGDRRVPTEKRPSAGTFLGRVNPLAPSVEAWDVIPMELPDIAPGIRPAGAHTLRPMRPAGSAMPKSLRKSNPVFDPAPVGHSRSAARRPRKSGMSGFAAIPAALKRFLSSLSSLQIGAISLSLVALVGAIDLATGYELSASIFYTIPVGIGAWYVGRRFGIFVCVVSAVAWSAADAIAGHQYSHPAILFWNGLVRLGFFAIIAFLLDSLRRAIEVRDLLAQQDGLTGIMNARTFRQRCDSIFALASRHGRPLAIGYLDLDGFKGVNDTLGHGIGDQVLREVAAALTKRLRTSDLGGRLGGDEFAVLLPETDIAGARTFFMELREDLVGLAATNRWPVGFSIGVAVFHSPPTNPDDAIRCADELMYNVKKSGRNNILFEEHADLHRSA